MRPVSKALFALVLCLVALTGCQMQVAVDVVVDDGGGGVVTVGVGLDEAALARAGNLDQVLRVDDLRSGGWTVTPATAEPDGTTWVRASKPFADPAQFAVVMDEITGPAGIFKDFELRRDAGTFGTTSQVTGTVDLTQGPAAFSDPALTESLGGDPFGGTLTSIEQAEGRTAADMVGFTVRVDVPGASEPTVYTPSFHDPAPTAVDVEGTQKSWLSQVWIWGLVVLVVVIGLFVLRSGFTRLRR